MPEFRIGKECFFGVSASGTTGTTEVKCLSDLVVDPSPDVVEFKTRGSKYTKVLTGSMNLVISGTIEWDPEDPAFKIIRTAFQTSADIGVTIKDGGASVFTGAAASENLDGAYKVTNFPRTEPEDGVTTAFEIRPSGRAADPVWSEITAQSQTVQNQ